VQVTNSSTVGGTGITFLWNANPSGDTIRYYNLYSGTSSGVYGTPVNMGLVTTYSIPSPGVTTYYAITAVNDNGESIPSDELIR
jgi:hypothetical protein